LIASDHCLTLSQVKMTVKNIASLDSTEDTHLREESYPAR
jgi:hypothetical protein